MKYLPFIALLSVSCSTMDYEATTNKGTEKFAYRTFGGSSVIDTAGGTRVAQNHNKTGGQFFQTLAAGLAAWGRAFTINSDNNLAATQSAQAADVTNTAAREATKQADIAAEAATNAIKFAP